MRHDENEVRLQAREAGRRTCCERETGTEELCDQVGFHIVGVEPSEAPTEGQQSRWLTHYWRGA